MNSYKLVRGVLLPIAILGSLWGTPSPRLAWAATFSVTNTNDSGAGSLRQAVLDANASPGADTITFAIGATGSPQTIQLTSALPAISGPVMVDGWSQGGGGYVGPPLIELNGSAIPTWNTSDGLSITAGDTTVRGLAINYFNIAINLATAGNNILTGNYLGLALDGVTPIGNRTGIRIAASSDGNRIGTDGDGVNDTAERNVISASGVVQQNNSFGFLIDQGSDNNRIAGNYIGTDATGTLDRGNTQGGIVTGGVTLIGTNGDGVGDEVEGNLISGNGGHGVSLSTTSSGSRVAGNKIGTDVTGTAALPNNSNGVSVGSCSPGQCSDYIIGTNGDGVSDALEGNLISGNGSSGVYIPSGTLDNNVIAGNKIGTNISGTAALPNGGYGVHLGGDFSRLGTNNDGLSDTLEGNLISGNGDGAGNDNHGVAIPSGADHNTIAGNKIGTNGDGTAAIPNGQTGVQVGDDFNAITGNLISGNGQHGIYLFDAFFNTVTSNRIGTALDGATPISNTLHGIFISINSDDNLIGGTDVTAANVIAFNGGDGVFVDGGSSCGAAFCLRNRIVGNAIFENTGLGIDLYPNGVNANDPLDPDTGANTQQNHPALAAATSVGANLIITGMLNSTANLTFTLDFYGSSTCDLTGLGEGAVYLGAGQAATDANGDAAFALSVAGLAQDGDAVTATATDPDGNTSEFSSCITNVGEEPITGLQALNDSPTFLGLTTHFSATLTSGTGVSYAWDFGDGVTGSGANPTHVYTAIGSYTATVAASNGLGSTEASTTITILPSPTCAATPDDGVTVFGSLDAGAVQQAVDSPAAAGGTVKIAGVCAGVSTRNGFTQTVYIEDMLTLAGGYSMDNWNISDPINNPTILDALGQGRVIFALGAPLTLENLVVTNGNVAGSGTDTCPDYGCGGGLFTWGDLTVSNVTLKNNQANRGGGAYVAGALTARDTDWLDNTGTTQRGGAFEVYGDADITGGLVQGNAGRYAGGLFADTGLIISGTQFISNTATSTASGSGGAIYAAGSLDITNALFQSNQAQTGAGAVLHSPGTPDEFLSIVNTQFISNTAQHSSAQGGALYTSAASSTIQASTFEGNSVPGSSGGGGAIVAYKSMTLTETTLISNTTGGQGGAIFHWGLSEPGNVDQVYPLVMINSQVMGNQAGAEGGGVYFRRGWSAENTPIQFTNTTFKDNTATLAGGGVYLGQPGSLTQTEFLDNHSATAEGGGLYTEDRLALLQTTFQSNSALGAGGAYVQGALTVTDTRWLDNTCTTNEGGALEVYGDTIMTGGLVQGNACPLAGGIFSNGSLTIHSTHFISNTATDLSNAVGGAVYAIGSLTLTEAVFQGNRSNSIAAAMYVKGTLSAVDSVWVANDCLGPGYNSGIIWVDGEANLTGGRMEGNTCDFGSGIAAWARLTISGTHFISNTAPSPNGATGGAVISFGPLEITNALFRGNRAFGYGGALVHLSSSDPLTITHSEFIDNATLWEGGAGGALTTSGPTTILTSTFQANNVRGVGGAILAYQAITLIETSLLSNTAGLQGGALYHEGRLDLSTGEVYPLVILNSLLTGNQAGGEGGGVYFYPGPVAQNVPIHFLQTTFQNNSAGLNGGGAFLPQPALVEDSTFRGNTSLNGAGGGLFTAGQLTLDSAVLTGNHAGINGGGLAVQSNGAAPGQIVNSVFASNTTTTGATLLVSGTRPLNILHTTFAGADTPTQGIAVNGAPVAITNTIVVSHTTGILASGGAVVTAKHTLFYNNRVNAQEVTNLNPVYGNPRFLNPSGGDFHLTLRSPAIDMGGSTGITSDFEDDPRPIITKSDIGADEFGGAATGDPGSTTTVSSTVGSGSQVVVIIPAGALTNSTNIFLMPTFPPSSLPPLPWIPVLPGFQLMTTPAGYAAAQLDTTFLVPVTVTLTYTDGALVGVNENSLFLAVRDETTGAWVDATTTCAQTGVIVRNIQENQIMITTCATGEFALLGNLNVRYVFLPLVSRSGP